MMWRRTIGNLHYVPIALFFILPVAFFLSYAFAVSLGHVAPIFPYISDCGTFQPQSSIFSQLLNLAAALILAVIYIRYLQIKELPNSLGLPSTLGVWNMAGLILGILTSLGLSVVANFQLTNILIVHIIGAVVCFGCGTGYFWVQVWMAYRVRCIKCSVIMCVTRFFLALANTIFFVFIFVGAFFASQSYNGEDMFHWPMDVEGYEWHLVSTVSEWLCAGCFCLYMLTLGYDFRNLELTNPRIIYKDWEQNQFTKL